MSDDYSLEVKIGENIQWQRLIKALDSPELSHSEELEHGDIIIHKLAVFTPVTFQQETNSMPARIAENWGI